MRPEEFGCMLFGDYMDALTGYNEGENEKIRYFTEVIRLATTILWNIQVTSDDRREPERLWPLPWDEKKRVTEMPEEEVKRIIELQIAYLEKQK